MPELPSISTLITTYNGRENLRRVLEALKQQSRQPDEILVCDDGSSDGTDVLVAESRAANPRIRHVYQEDDGWNVAKIRNRGILAAQSDYLVFLDGDCLPHPDFIRDHARLAKAGCFVAGDRAHVLEAHKEGFDIRGWTVWKYLLTAKIRKRSRALRWPFENPREYALNQIRDFDTLATQIIACNMAVWKKDAVAVNGFCMSFKRWGPEDAEFAARLLNTGLMMRLVTRQAVLFHLDHAASSKQDTASLYDYAQKILESGVTWTNQGLDSLPTTGT